MRLSALSRRSSDLQNGGGPSPLSLSYATRIFFLILGFVLLFLFTPLKVNAQVNSLANFAKPNVDASVTQDQHTLVQSVTIEVISSLICQVAGIDVVNPQQGCLNINPTTHTLSYAKTDHVGGILGMGTQMIGGLYTPPASGVSYMRDLASNFGITKHSYAQSTCAPTDKPVPGCEPPTGFDALQPVQKIWLALRNLTYMLFIIVFIILGIAIMLRYKIDGHGHGQTVMSIQNQLPKVVIALIMITFSYAIVGLLVDFMWATTYFGINVLTTADNPYTKTCDADLVDVRDPNTGQITQKPDIKYSVQSVSFRNILNNPLAFMNDIFHHSVCQIDTNTDLDSGKSGDIKGISSGIAYLSWKVGRSMGTIVDGTIRALIDPGNAGCGLTNISGCIGHALGAVLDWFISVLGLLIAVCALLFALFKLWWSLLKAYAYVVVYTIIGPIFILLGLIPGSHNGFSSWFRKVVANLAVFPAAAFLIITARIILDLYTAKNSTNFFVTPLIGNPNIGIIGPLLAFGLLMLAPELVNLVKTALGAPPGQIGGIIQSNFAAGIGPGMYPIRQPWNRIMARGGHGEDAGMLRKALVGMGNPNDPNVKPHQRLFRSLGVSRGFKSDWRPPENNITGGGGGDSHST